MLHTMWRLARSLASALLVLAVFALWCAIAAAATGRAEIFGLLAFVAVFFCPAAFISTWEAIGD